MLNGYSLINFICRIKTYWQFPFLKGGTIYEKIDSIYQTLPEIKKQVTFPVSMCNISN
jgi:hypothetical protein